MFWTVILIFVLLSSILFGIGGFLISHWWFKPKNNPKLATIFIDGIAKPFKGILRATSEKGQRYEYAHGVGVVFVPNTYKYSYHNYRRDIFLNNAHNLIAIPFNDDKSLRSSSEKNDLIRELVQSNIGAEAIKAIKGKQSFSIGVIIFIAIAIIISGIVGYAIHKPTVINPAVTPQITENKTLPILPSGIQPPMTIEPDNNGVKK